jgi:hypothetical protein
LNSAAWRKIDLYPTSCIGFVNWLTTQVRLAHDLSLLPARKSPIAGTFLAEADRNDVGSALARERFLDALLCERQRTLAEVRQLAAREGWCYQHFQAIAVAIDQYAAQAYGNREFVFTDR